VCEDDVADVDVDVDGVVVMSYDIDVVVAVVAAVCVGVAGGIGDVVCTVCGVTCRCQWC